MLAPRVCRVPELGLGEQGLERRRPERRLEQEDGLVRGQEDFVPVEPGRLLRIERRPRGDEVTNRVLRSLSQRDDEHRAPGGAQLQRGQPLGDLADDARLRDGGDRYRKSGPPLEDDGRPSVDPVRRGASDANHAEALVADVAGDGVRVGEPVELEAARSEIELAGCKRKRSLAPDDSVGPLHGRMICPVEASAIRPGTDRSCGKPAATRRRREAPTCA